MKSSKVEKSQVEKFREAARELETDDSEEAFAALVKRIAKPNSKSDHDETVAAWTRDPTAKRPPKDE